MSGSSPRKITGPINPISGSRASPAMTWRVFTSTTLSSSMKKHRSLCDARQPRLRAPAKSRPLPQRRSVTPGACKTSRPVVPSGSLSTTRTSAGSRAPATKDATKERTASGRRKVGITTATLGMSVAAIKLATPSQDRIYVDMDTAEARSSSKISLDGTVAARRPPLHLLALAASTSRNLLAVVSNERVELQR